MYKDVALRLGLMSTRPTGALALMSQQHEVVHVILNKLLRELAFIKLPRNVSLVVGDINSTFICVCFFKRPVGTKYR